MKRLLAFSLLFLASPAFGARSFGATAAALVPARVPLVRRGPFCAHLYDQLSAFHINAELSFLDEALREELRRAAKILHEDLRRFHAPTPFFDFHPQLKSLVDKLVLERDRHVQAGIRLRAERRALRDRLAQTRRELSPSEEARWRSILAGKEDLLKQNATELEAVYRTLEPLRQALGLGTMVEAARRSSREKNAVVVLHSMHPAAAAQFTREGVGKGMRHKFNSADTGVIAGLVPYDQSLSVKVARGGPAVVAEKQAAVEQAIRDGHVVKQEYRVGSLVAVKREGGVSFVNDSLSPVREDEIAYVLAEVSARRDGRSLPIISDIDPAAFGFARRPEGLAEPTSHPRFGILTEEEREVIASFNHHASELLERKDEPYRYMTHGPETRNPHSTGPSGYPMPAFVPPEGALRLIERGPPGDPHRFYRAFVREMRERGYEVPVNPRWNWAP